MPSILGLSAFYHDSAATLVIDGNIVSAVQEERFTRIKHDPSFPINSIKYILSENSLSILDIDYIVFYEKPFLKFERIIETYVSNVPKGFEQFAKALPIWLREKLFLKKILLNEFKNISNKFDKTKLLFNEHHLSHAASAFYPSPFKKSLIFTFDGVGEWSTTTIGTGDNNKIKILKHLKFPHSLGLIYSAFTYYLGFKVNSGEYKVMGLAPYGTPKYRDLILKHLIDLKEDGSFRLDQSYLNYSTGLTMINNKFINLFGKTNREPEKEEINQFHMDIASSIQLVLEEIIIKIIVYFTKKYEIYDICLAGGVALNCAANGKLLKNKLINNIWIQPASGDAGGSLGAALYTYYKIFNANRVISKNDSMSGSYLGSSYNGNQIRDELDKVSANYKKHNTDDMLNKTIKDLLEGKIVGWFQGKMEFGPRALGSRSIIADPRSPQMQKKLNLKIKYRESFRPFAPSILIEHCQKWFNLNKPSPYMLFIADIQDEHKLKLKNENSLFGIDKLNQIRSNIPAVTHVDNTARVQTVSKETNFIFYSLIEKFYNKTGCPLLINTSFNVRSEPIVNTPYDAFKCFMGTELDTLIIGNYV
ncbi:carbamoyltransferase, partial [Alphaproteobacteria bacterium]|nr:carbamoyltransferase [Alphaproteobacteria bacterium]